MARNNQNKEYDMHTEVKEILDRTRRIETKLTRMLNGDSDKGVTKLEYSLDRRPDGVWKLDMRSLNVTVVQLSNALAEEQVMPGDEIDLFDNGRYTFTVTIN